jgi:hypothetical protein
VSRTLLLSVMVVALVSITGPPGRMLAVEVSPVPGTGETTIVDRTPPVLPAAEPGSAPLAVVSALLDAFARRDEQQYTRWMTEDYVFWSDEPGFARRFPNGYSRGDELRFATHLFAGGGIGPDGRALPVATSARLANGPVSLVPLASGPAQARLVLHDLDVTLELADGTELAIGGTQNVIDLTLTESGWRVRRWIETHGERGEADELAVTLGADGGAPVDYARLLPPRAPRPVGPWAGMSTHIVWRRPND